MSLNDILLAGPKTQADILDLLIALRFWNVLIKSDLTKMFHQVVVRLADRDYLRFLWRSNDDESVKIYRWRRIPFGLSQSPFLAIATVLYHASSHAMEFPEVAEALTKSLYVDDLITGVSDVTSAINLKEDLDFVMSLASFKFVKWISNSPEFLAGIPQEDRAKASNYLFRDSATEEDEKESLNKTLGVAWNPSTDTFNFQGFSILRYEEGRETKRTLCSKTARIFDPQGLLAPFTLRPKILFQKCWVDKVDWDDPLPPDINEQWKQWLHELPDLKGYHPRRCLLPAAPVLNTQIHIFSDASDDAYAAVAYIRFVTEDKTTAEEQIHVGLIAAKTRVAPLKSLQTAKLELMGILIGARLATRILKVMNDKFPFLKVTKDKVFLWTDSEVAATWARGPPQRWATFVANRVAEIQDLFPPTCFRHIPGVCNVSADIASRGAPAKELKYNRDWLHGPAILYQSDEYWEDIPIDPNLEQERRKTTRAHAVMAEDPVITYLLSLADDGAAKEMSYPSLLRVLAYALRFPSNAKKPVAERDFSVPPTLKDMRKAEIVWLKICQTSAFAAEIEYLKGGIQGKPIPSNFAKLQLQKLSPFIDEDGLMRVGGRLAHSDLNEDGKHPIILPSRSPLVEKLALHMHRSYLHSPLGQTNYELRRKFWLLKGRSELRRILHQCHECKRRLAQPFQQKMAPLPAERLQPNSAFSVVGVDTAGPILICKDKTSEDDEGDPSPTLQKAYLLLFTCASTRGVHLDILHDLTTETLIQALVRFIGRRGVPKLIWSDNALSFTKAGRELASLWKKIDEEKLKKYALSLPSPVEWTFITPRSPWHGGIWERLIRSVKTALRACLGKALLTYVELYSTVVGIEGQLNSRPITSLSSNPEDDLPLTPFHLIMGRPFRQLPDTFVRDGDFAATSIRWKHRAALQDKFWRRWKKEYLSELLASQKWHVVANSPKKDELVLVGDESPRATWLLGRILEVTHGRDGLTRSCVVKTKKGIIRRAVQKLYRLEHDVPKEE